MTRHIAIVGAGWAGCAAAVELVDKGHRVTLFEAARTLGGRARKVDVNSGTLDNGQHILLGAYTETLRLMRRVGIDLPSALLRLPLQMRFPNNTGMDFVTAKLPAPLNLLVGLLRTKGLNRSDKQALIHFSLAARKIGWTLDADRTVTTLLQELSQTDRLVALMWRPLCLAALNTPPEQASAQVFLNVLKDSLGADRASSDMLLPRQDLTALFPQQAMRYVMDHGGTVRTGMRVAVIDHKASRWQLSTQNDAANKVEFDQVVVATDVRNATTLLAPLRIETPMPAVSFQPITTCYLQYADTCKLDAVFYALIDDSQSAHWGQFVFDRGQMTIEQKGLFAVVISASTQAQILSHSELSNAIARQLATVFSRPELASPLWTKIITEKNATFSCVPSLHRPENQTAFPGLVLAGDYTESRYPATLEAAVRSGVAAAQLLSNC